MKKKHIVKQSKNYNLNYITVIECIKSGFHLANCDDDGYCNACGHQTLPETKKQSKKER